MSASLLSEIESAHTPKYLFFSGKGGVGKTSISSTTAVWLAHRYRVLHVSTDLQKSLNDIYQQEIGSEPTPIHGVPNLWAVNIETAESMERHRGKIMETLALVDPDSLMLKQMKDDHLTDCGCAQAAVFEMTDYLNSTQYDVIVFDTAPASSSLQKIETQSRMVLSLVKQIDVKKKLQEVFDAEGLQAQIDSLEQIRSRDEKAFEVLRSNSTVFTMILIPEALPFAELQRAIEDLEERHHIGVKGIVINNVLPAEERDGSSFWLEHWAMQGRYIGLVQEQYAGRALAQVPLLSTETVGLGQLRTLGEELYGPQQSLADRQPVTVAFYPAPSSDSALSGCSCSCGSDAGVDINELLMERASALDDVFGRAVKVEVANYWSTAATSQAIERLKDALHRSGKSFVLSPENFYTFAESVMPIVTVDGQIVSTGRVPESSALEAAVNKALQMVPEQAGR